MKRTAPHVENRFSAAPLALRELELHSLLEARARIVMRAGWMDEAMELEPEEPELEIVNGVGIIHINGCLGMGLAEWEKKYLGMTDVDDVSALIGEAVASANVGAILLGINSPGGSVSGIPELAARIYAARAQKPVIAWTRSVCASAAYWIGAQANALFASTSAIVGSIGVYTCLLDTSKAYDEAGYKMHLVKAGANKAIGAPGIPVTDDQLAVIQQRVDTMYGMFTRDVVRGRGGVAKQESFDGSDWFAADALSRGLIDEIHDTADAVMAQVQELIR